MDDKRQFPRNQVTTLFGWMKMALSTPFPLHKYLTQNKEYNHDK